MRIVFVGGNKVSKVTVNRLTEAGHDIVIIESNEERIEELSELLDCGFIHGDGTKIEILKEVDPSKTDVLVCGTDNDHANVISSLLAKSLGFKKVITMISELELDPICCSLGLDNTIFSAKTIGAYLQELIHGRDVFEMTEAFKNQLTLFSFHAAKSQKIEEIKLPDRCRIVWIYRKDAFFFPEANLSLEKGDHMVIAADQNQLEALEKLFVSRTAS